MRGLLRRCVGQMVGSLSQRCLKGGACEPRRYGIYCLYINRHFNLHCLRGFIEQNVMDYHIHIKKQA